VTDATEHSLDRLAAIESPTVPAFGELSADLYVAFTVRPFRHARIAWLNHRWFASMGVDLTISMVRERVEQWLLDRFAVGVPSDDDPGDLYVEHEKELFADRYGAPTGCAPGGSGRVGTFGNFCAKGIGRTPLVSRQSDWYHSHGCMWLEEAVREAILSEVATQAFPHRAVPTIALIDLGARLRWHDGSSGARRAIIVRPAFLRLASLMRSIYFGSSGHFDSDQAADARRVRDLWQKLWPDSSAANALAETFITVGQQYGHGHALRLWPGPFFASNITLDGRLVDFGSFRALPNWMRARGDFRSHEFGNETMLAATVAKALERLSTRLPQRVDASMLLEQFKLGFKDGYWAALAKSGITSESSAAHTLEGIRKRQQCTVTDLTGGDAPAVSIGGLKPWASIYRETLLAEAETMIEALGEGVVSDLNPIARFIDSHIEEADPNSPNMHRIPMSYSAAN